MLKLHLEGQEFSRTGGGRRSRPQEAQAPEAESWYKACRCPGCRDSQHCDPERDEGGLGPLKGPPRPQVFALKQERTSQGFLSGVDENICAV